MFWQVEEAHPAYSPLKTEEQQAEDTFLNTHTREYDGRYSMLLPLNGKPPPMAIKTRNTTLGTYNSTRHKFLHNPPLTEEYACFIVQYKALGHMEQVPVEKLHNPNAWYLHHHSVDNIGSNRKQRVVFDASRKAYKYHYLNCFL